MRMRMIHIVLLIILGAIGNILLVSWVCAAWSEHESRSSEADIEAPTEWPSYLQQLNWPAPSSATERKGGGIGVTHIDIAGWSESGSS